MCTEIKKSQTEAIVRSCSVLKNFTKFAGEHQCQSLFFNKIAGLRRETLSKIDSDTGLLSWIL